MKSLIDQLRSLMAEQEVEAYYVPNNDEFQNEYLPDSAKRLEFITGFTGSAGSAIIAHDKAAFFTDGRYTIQAAAEVDSNIFEIYNIKDLKPSEWLEKEHITVHYDPWLVTLDQARNLDGEALKGNLIDLLWEDQPSPPSGKAEIFPLEYAGKAHQYKIAKIASELEADAVILTTADSVNWLFNIRGSDIAYTPFCLAYAVIYKSGEAELYIEEEKLSDELRSHLADVKILKLSDIRSIKAQSIQLDPKTCPKAISSCLNPRIIDSSDPCQLPKAIKNEVEIDGIRKAHEIDGAAVTKFIEWLKQNPEQDEISAAAKLAEFRQQNPAYKQPSFTTISGFGSNGAIVHYSVSPETSKKFTKNNLYLVDSGGQYMGQENGVRACGTTDITRTIAIGDPTDEMKHDYTLVLKGHIAIATAEFEAGTNGADLDPLARQFLRSDHKDYDHGTGHGVGHYLSVHEGPCGISPRTKAELVPGMVISNEPGYYKENGYGIRIENLVLVVEKESEAGAEPAMRPRSGIPTEGQETRRGTIKKLGFETLTLAPLDESLIEYEILTSEEKDWIKEYHERVFANI